MRGPSGGGDVVEVALEVADDAVHAQARELVDELVGAARATIDSVTSSGT